MKYNFYIDETWDHSLLNINENFPYFLLCWILISEDEDKKLNEQVNKLKIDFFWTTEVILHSRDIRKCDKSFKILFDLDIKKKFYDRLELILKNIQFEIISIWIKKENYIKKYWKTAENPYQLSLSYMLERLIFCIQDNDWKVNIYVEKRWKKEDKKLLEYYNMLYNTGTYFVNSNDFKNRIKWFDFRNKNKNDIWIQIADLCAYPLVCKIRRPKEPNLSYDLLKEKIYQRNGKVYGFKVHP
jgi:hypothetical protein